MGPFGDTWAPTFSPRGGQEGQEGPQKGCPNLGSILRPKMTPKSFFLFFTNLGPWRALEPARTRFRLNWLLGRSGTSIFIVFWLQIVRKMYLSQLPFHLCALPSAAHCAPAGKHHNLRIPREAALPRRKASWMNRSTDTIKK